MQVVMRETTAGAGVVDHVWRGPVSPGVLDALDLDPYGPGRVRVWMTADGVRNDDPEGALVVDPVTDPCAFAAHAWLAIAEAWRRGDRTVGWSPRFVRLVINDLHDAFSDGDGPIGVAAVRREAVARSREAHAWATAVGAAERTLLS